MPTLSITPAELAIAIAFAFLGSVVQGSIGFGLAVVAAPILLMVNPVFVPGPMLLAAMLLVVLMALRERRDVIVRDIGLACVGRALGTLPAAYIVSSLPLSTFELLFAGLVILGVVLSASGWHIPRTPPNVAIAAVLSGFSGTVSSVGGPPLAMVYQNERGPQIRGTLSAIFTMGTLISLAGLWWAGRFGAEELLAGVLLFPGVVFGFALSRYTAAWIDGARMKPAVLAVSGLSALLVMLRALSAHL